MYGIVTISGIINILQLDLKIPIIKSEIINKVESYINNSLAILYEDEEEVKEIEDMKYFRIMLNIQGIKYYFADNPQVVKYFHNTLIMDIINKKMREIKIKSNTAMSVAMKQIPVDTKRKIALQEDCLKWLQSVY